MLPLYRIDFLLFFNFEIINKYMHKNFGGSLYKIEFIKAEAFSIEEAANLLRNVVPEVRGLFSEVSKLNILLMVSPASRYEAEESFSALRRP